MSVTQAGTTARRCACAGVCGDRIPRRGGGWSCRRLVEAGVLDDPRRVEHEPPLVDPGGPTFQTPIALALIAQHHCACRRCNGQLAACEWPSWRRCVECGCCWKADDIGNRRYACRTRDDGRRCLTQADPEEDPR